MAKKKKKNGRRKYPQVSRSTQLKKSKRGYSGADWGRLFADWSAQDGKHADDEIYSSVERLRARSRELSRNNSYVRRFEQELAVNILGEKGVKVLPKPKTKKGLVDTRATTAIQNAWGKFCERGNFTADRMFDRQNFMRTALTTVARDGDVLIELHKGFSNDSNFALSAREGDYLRNDDNKAEENVRMGVQFDEFGAQMGFRIQSRKGGYPFSGKSEQRFRFLPAETHPERGRSNTGILPYDIDRFGQSRGTPWIASAMKNLHQLEQFEEAAVIGARINSSSLGLLFDASGEPTAGDTGGFSPTMKMQPGSIQRVIGAPEDFQLETFDLSDPNAQFAPFRDAILRGIASGMMSNHAVIANDYSQANYSSLRAAALSERESWRIIQEFWINAVERPVYVAWLQWALLSGAIPGYGPADFDRVRFADFEARRWSAVDPHKEYQAIEAGIALGITSRQREARKMGHEYDQIIAEQAEDNATAEAAGVVLPNPQGSKKDETEEKPDAESAENQA